MYRFSSLMFKGIEHCAVPCIQNITEHRGGCVMHAIYFIYVWFQATVLMQYIDHRS